MSVRQSRKPEPSPGDVEKLFKEINKAVPDSVWQLPKDSEYHQLEVEERKLRKSLEKSPIAKKIDKIRERQNELSKLYRAKRNKFLHRIAVVKRRYLLYGVSASVVEDLRKILIELESSQFSRQTTED